MKVSCARRGQFEIGLVQVADTCACRRQVAVVCYDIIGDGEPFLAAGLRRNDAFGLLAGLVIAGQQPFELYLRAAIHHQDPIHGLAHWRFEEQRDHDDNVGLGRFPGSPVGDIANQRMKDALEFCPFGVVGKDDAPYDRPVQPAMFVDHGVAESSPDSVECRRAGCDHLSCDHIRIDDRDAKFGEKIRDGGFAAGNAAGEADPECRFTPGRDGRISRSLSP